jgi:DNA-binding winged helix-turn-helix (wHTH) protein/TolB-like protein/Flp pilus assembly protein TadD
MSELTPGNYVFGDFRIDSTKRLLLRDGQGVALTPKVFETLLYLVENRGKVVAKDELMTAVWPDTVVEENNLNQNISTLRKVLGESRGENRYIATVPGKGYRFVADVRETPTGASTRLDDQMKTLPPAGSKNLWLIAAGALIVAGIFAVSYRTWMTRPRVSQTGGVRSLAVLPFKPLGAAKDDAVLELGMADTLITKLNGVSELEVRPIGAVRRFTDAGEDPATVGRKLQVDAVLEGSIEEYAGRIRMTVRLVRTADRRQIWSGRFDENAGDIFAVQDSISERVAQELAGKLTSEEHAQLKKRYTENPVAYELYLKGSYFWQQRTREATTKAIDYFHQALAMDPKYALAYTGIANCYSAMPISSDVASEQAFPRAKEAAIRALEIDGSLAEAHESLAYLHYFFDWDWEESRKEYERALVINPNSPVAHWGYALLLSSLGDHEKALQEVDQALKLDPGWPLTGALKGHFLFQARRYPEAIAQLQKTLEMDQNFWITHIELGKTYERAGRYSEALESFQKAEELSGGTSETASLMGFTYAMAGRRAEATRILQSLKARMNERYVPPYHLALIYAALGDRAETLRWLDRAYHEKDVHMVFLGVDPKWDGMRGQPQFDSLLGKMKLGGAIVRRF